MSTKTYASRLFPCEFEIVLKIYDKNHDDVT